MLLVEHSAILSTFIKLPFLIKIFVLSILNGSFTKFYCTPKELESVECASFLGQLCLISDPLIGSMFHNGIHDPKRQGDIIYTTVKPVLRGHSKRSKIGFQDRLSLNAGQKYCRMLQYFRPFVFKTIVSSIFEWPLKGLLYSEKR